MPKDLHLRQYNLQLWFQCAMNKNNHKKMLTRDVERPSLTDRHFLFQSYELEFL